MIQKNNYLKYYKKMYSKKRKNNFKFIGVFLSIILMFILTIFLFYIFIGQENTSVKSIDSQDINQVVNIKQKGLRKDFSLWNKTCDWNLLVVNNDNCIPDYFTPSLKKYGDIEVDERIIMDLNEMIQEARKEDILLWVSSGYRTIKKQEQLFNKGIEEYKKNGLTQENAIDETIKVFSRPKTSEHNTGLSVDFNAMGEEFKDTKEYDWLLKNSTNYGFILRYQEDKEYITNRHFEPAHFRYVGEEHAQIMKSKNLCLEEYVSTLIE